jgi:hypothetical protein
MADSAPRLVRGLRDRAVRAFLAVAALGTILIASIAAGAPAPTVTKPRTLVTREPVISLAADGDRAALVVGNRGLCAGVVVWEPTRRRVVWLKRPCRYEVSRIEGTEGVTLAATRAAWLHSTGGHTLEESVETATLARPATLARLTPISVGYGSSNTANGLGNFARRPVGDGTLLAFTLDRRCEEGDDSNPCPPGRKSGDLVAATVWRVAGRGLCPSGISRVRKCSRVAQADGELSVLAVDAGHIAVRTDTGLRLLTTGGAVLRDFDLQARAAALSGGRLAIRTADAVEVYDTGSGQLVASFPAASHLRLEDLDRDILVTAAGRMVMLRRLGDGRTTTIRLPRIARAQLERPGLFVAAGRRVTFTPMRDVLRRLGD